MFASRFIKFFSCLHHFLFCRQNRWVLIEIVFRHQLPHFFLYLHHGHAQFIGRPGTFRGCGIRASATSGKKDEKRKDNNREMSDFHDIIFEELLKSFQLKNKKILSPPQERSLRLDLPSALVQGSPMKLIITSLSCFFLAACGGSSSRTFVSIGTGSQTGVYYPVGGAIKQLAEDAEASSLSVSAKASRGSVQNINDVLSGAATFGIAQADRQYQAVNGLSNWDGTPQEDLRFVFSLHPEVVTLIAAVDSGIESLEDLKGKRVNLGSPGSGHRGNAMAILEAAGIDPEADIQAESLTVGECASMLQDNRLDAYFYTVGHPNGSITEASTGRRTVRFVPITGMDALIETSPFYTTTEVPTHLYERAEQGDVESIGMLTTFVTNAAVDDDTVYTLVKAVFENLDLLRQQHPALQGLTKEGMLKGAHAPLHPGAERYYQEAGLL